MIDPKTIDNGWSVHEVLTRVIPALNALEARLQALEGRLGTPQPAPAPAPESTTEVAPPAPRKRAPRRKKAADE